jgi:predicted XRE-type DNA-binding protein
VDFRDLHNALIAELTERIRGGELTERGLARLVGISQPHVHNVLKGKRGFSVEKSDVILHRLHMDVRDLVRLVEGPEGQLGR